MHPMANETIHESRCRMTDQKIADTKGPPVAESPYYQDGATTLWLGDALKVANTLPDESVNCIITSPPYFGLRDYGEHGQYGLEATPNAYVAVMVKLFRELRRVLADDGTMWLNIGDSYNAYNGNRGASNTGFSKNGPLPSLPSGAGLTVKGLATKNLLGIPWRTALALQDSGWILRNDIIWSKPNAMPESVTDRLSARHEHLFMFAKSPRYWFNLDPIREPHVSTPGQYSEGGRNPGDVWDIATQPFPGAHFATMPTRLAERCVLAGCPPGGTVLDPFSGSGTTGLAANKHGRRYIGIDINSEYLDLSLATRLAEPGLLGVLP